MYADRMMQCYMHKHNQAHSHNSPCRAYLVRTAYCRVLAIILRKDIRIKPADAALDAQYTSLLIGVMQGNVMIQRYPHSADHATFCGT
jgi:hypothetical protein